MAMSTSELEQALQTFFKKHASETLVAITIDAGSIYIQTEEGFQRRIKKSAADWEAATTRPQDRARGNPYTTPGAGRWDRMRFGTGNFEYQELINLGLDDEYHAHYEDDQQATSPYAIKVAELVAALKANQNKLLAGVKLSEDFRICAVDHDL